MCVIISSGALELESVEVKVQISESDSTNIEDLIPKQVGAMKHVPKQAGNDEFVVMNLSIVQENNYYTCQI